MTQRTCVLAAFALLSASCSDTSGPANVGAHLEFEGVPVPVGAGAGFATPPQVMVRDEAGALVRDWSEEVSLSLAGDGTTLAGDTAVAPVGGVAAFHGLTLEGGGAGLRLVARSGSLAEVSSSSFDVPGAFAAVELVAGSYHTCALNRDGAAYCWGRNGHGQLGDGGTTNRQRPTLVQGGVPFAHLAAEGEHTCGLTPDGAVYCWGGNNWGQVGTGTTADVTWPALVTLPGKVTRVDAGYYHTCALLEDGTAYCWGYNSSGVLGTGSPEDAVLTPQAVMTELRFTALSAGYEHTCGLTAQGEAYCWGWNTYGELGDSTGPEARTAPNRVSEDPLFASLEAGGGPCHGETCGIGLDGTTYCWGKNYQPAAPDFNRFAAVPTAVEGDPGFAHVIPGPLVVCGIDAGGALSCWGDPFHGQLANGSLNSERMPTRVMPERRIASVAMGLAHICVADQDLGTWCWGENSSGQLGNPSNPLGWTLPVPVWASSGS